MTLIRCLVRLVFLIRSILFVLAVLRVQGGIGKTVTGAALARDMEIRMMYDQIVWLPLGQTPVIDKLQRMQLRQLTGEEIPNDMSKEDRHELLRRGMAGKKVLLCLDVSGDAPVPVYRWCKGA